MKNMTKIILVCSIILVVIVLALGVSKANKKTEEKYLEEQTANVSEEVLVEEKVIELLEVNEEFIYVKSNSDQRIEKLEFSYQGVIYEMYDLEKGDVYVSNNYYYVDNDEDIEIISIDYDTIVEHDVTISYEVNENTVSGQVTNVSDANIYPLRIVGYVQDENGNIMQITAEYAGCFDDGKIIYSSQALDFELEIPEGYTLIQSKGIRAVYSDLQFETYETMSSLVEK